MRSLSQQVAQLVSSTLKALRKFLLPFLNVSLSFRDVYALLAIFRGASMSDKPKRQSRTQEGQARARSRSWEPVATALAVFNMTTNGSEAPSQAVMILQYAGLAGGLLALIGGLIMMAAARK